MALRNLLRSFALRVPAVTAVNNAGGKAYAYSDEHALAQYIVTGCFGATYYVQPQTQLDRVLELCAKLQSEYIAQAAIYARTRGHMKDTPALLLAVLASREGDEFEYAFPQVCTDGKMLRNFVGIMRSGVTGRRSLGSRPKRLILQWLESRSDEAIFRASVGNDPSMADIIKMVHPAPKTASRRALYGYLLGRPYDIEALPELVLNYELFKHDPERTAPAVPFEMLTSLNLPPSAWKDIARNARWQMTRMNLATFERHGVLEDHDMVRMIANRLRDPAEVRAAKVFPYQLLVAYMRAGQTVPSLIREALHDALEVAVENVPRVEGAVYVLPDVSGSMHSPVTGHRGTATSAVRCIDVAALLASAFLRANKEATVVPFSDHVLTANVERRDSVMTNAVRLASLPSGGTDCAAPLRWLNHRRAMGDLVIFVSDNESWINPGRRYSQGTGVMEEWNAYKQRNPAAKLVCIDIQPGGSTQAAERDDILNVGGFSDEVFSMIDRFVRGQMDPKHWVQEVKNIQLQQR